MNWYLVLVYLLLSTLGLFIVKESFNAGPPGWKLLLGASLYVLSFALWMLLLKSNYISVAYPVVVSLSIVLVTVTGYVFLHEPVKSNQLLGIAMIIVAVFLVSSP